MPSSGPRSQCAFGSKSNCGGSPDAAHFHVVVFGLADGDGLVGDVGDAGQQFLELLVDRVHLFIERGDLVGDGAHCLLPLGGVGAFALELADLDALLVLARFELFGFGNGGPALLVQGAEAIQIDRAAAGRQAFRNSLEVAPEVGEIVHVLPCYRMEGLFFLVLNFHLLEIFGFEDLAAIETFHVVHAVPAGDDLGARVLTSGLHNSA